MPMATYMYQVFQEIAFNGLCGQSWSYEKQILVPKTHGCSKCNLMLIGQAVMAKKDI